MKYQVYWEQIVPTRDDNHKKITKPMFVSKSKEHLDLTFK